MGVSLQVDCFQGSSDTNLALKGLARAGQAPTKPGVGAALAFGLPRQIPKIYFAFLLLSLGPVLDL